MLHIPRRRNKQVPNTPAITQRRTEITQRRTKITHSCYGKVSLALYLKCQVDPPRSRLESPVMLPAPQTRPSSLWSTILRCGGLFAAQAYEKGVMRGKGKRRRMGSVEQLGIIYCEYSWFFFIMCAHLFRNVCMFCCREMETSGEMEREIVGKNDRRLLGICNHLFPFIKIGTCPIVVCILLRI